MLFTKYMKCALYQTKCFTFVIFTPLINPKIRENIIPI